MMSAPAEGSYNESTYFSPDYINEWIIYKSINQLNALNQSIITYDIWADEQRNISSIYKIDKKIQTSILMPAIKAI